MVGVLHYGTGAVGCHTQLEVALLGRFDVLDLKERPRTSSSFSQLQLPQGLYFSPSTPLMLSVTVQGAKMAEMREVGRKGNKCRWAAKCPNFDDSNGNKYSDWA